MFLAFTTRTALMSHQRAAVAKVLPSRIGGLLMEMGTGKTRVAIELAKLRAHKVSRVVVFCPVSLKLNWRDEILKHTDCAPESIHVFDERTSERRLPSAFWVIVGIESMSASDRVALAINALMDDRTFAMVDESAYIKNPRAMRTARITEYAQTARYRMVMTGQPLSNGVRDLYAQMRFLSPKILGYNSFWSFANNHLEYHPKYKGLVVRAHKTDLLAAKMGPYVYQVTRDECLDLPGKIYKRRYFYRTDAQRDAYEQAKLEMLSLDSFNEWESLYAIFRLFTALQQITSGFWSRRAGNGAPLEQIELPHRRLDCLADVLREIPSYEKVIIWAKYHYDIQGIAQRLAAEFATDGAAFYHGGIKEATRAAELAKFRNEARFLVATPGTGAHGLTLNEAGHHVFYNNSFKYAERLQAEDRSCRIGQTRSVIYLDIVCADTIDERILRAQAQKENVADAFRREVEKVKGEGLREKLLSL